MLTAGLACRHGRGVCAVIRRKQVLVGTGPMAAAVSYPLVLWHRCLMWGATADEVGRVLLSDELLPADPAPGRDVWPLCLGRLRRAIDMGGDVAGCTANRTPVYRTGPPPSAAPPRGRRQAAAIQEITAYSRARRGIMRRRSLCCRSRAQRDLGREVPAAEG